MLPKTAPGNRSERRMNEPASERQRRDSGSPPPLHFARFQKPDLGARLRDRHLRWLRVMSDPPCTIGLDRSGRSPRHRTELVPPKTKSVSIVSSLPLPSEISSPAVKNHGRVSLLQWFPHSHSRSWRSENGWAAPHSHLIPFGSFQQRCH